jgi:hypothetical protein
MKNLYSSFSLLAAAILLHSELAGQCASTVAVGTSTNMFTAIRNGNHAVAVNKTLNMVTFVHRSNVNLFPGDNGGTLRYDLSVNAGATWTVDLGPLNPLGTNPGRYPNIAIYNPTNNTTPSNAYVSYLAPCITTLGAWTGIVSGVSQLTGMGVTENYNQNGIGSFQIPHSLAKGAPGVYWAIEPMPSITSGFYIYKGVWNSGSSDIIWNYNYTLSPSYYLGLSVYPSEYNIAFDPTGQTGWVCIMTHVTGGPSAAGLYPVLYKTTNGGNTWSGPIQVDLSGFSCISNTSGSAKSGNIENDLVVDVNGVPHIITTVGSASSYNFSYSSWHHMYDITMKNGLWVAYDLGNVQGGIGTFGSGTTANQIQAPQAARTADGTKVFFTWTDNSNYSLGAPNMLPNLYGKAFDVVQGMWTQTKSFTSCNANINGQILFPHMAEEVLEPSNNVYKLAVVYGVPTATNDLVNPAAFYFLDNLTFASSEFTVAPPAATVTIAQAPTVFVCPTGSVTISISGNPGDVVWSTGATTKTLGIAAGTLTSLSATAQVGCAIGSASIALVNLTVTPSAITQSICPGGSANFSVTGNAFSYTWMPGSQTGTSATLYPTSGTVSVTAMGSSSCLSTYTVPVTIMQVPSISIAGNNTICAGSVLSLTASGGQSYLWNNIDTSTVFTDTPSANTGYTVIGTAANTCTNSQTINVVVNPTPTITATSSHTGICAGQSMTLFANGAASYAWSGGPPTPTIAVSPPSSTSFTVTGMAANGCTTNLSVPVIVNPLPTLTITTNKASICKGEKATLTASGAASYTWASPASTSPTVLVSPTVTTVYNITGKSGFGCVNTATFSQTVSGCLGISSLTEAGSLLVYPNPAQGEFTISGAAGTKGIIFNELGQAIFTFRLGDDGISRIAVNLPAGIYFIRTDEINLPPVKLIVE